MALRDEMRNLWQKQNFWERLLIVLSALVLVFSMFYLVLAYGAPVHSSGGVSGGLLGAIDRDGTRALIILQAGVVGWYFLLRRTRAAEQSIVVDQRAHAMGQIASDSMSIRTDGILSLRQIVAFQSEEERRKIVEFLSIRIGELTRKEKGTHPSPQSESEKIEIAAEIATMTKVIAELTHGEQADG